MSKSQSVLDSQPTPAAARKGSTHVKETFFSTREKGILIN